MSERQEIIKQMLEMQKQFINYEQQHGISADEYFAPGENHPLYNFKEKYSELANKLVDIAHAEKKSKR